MATQSSSGDTSCTDKFNSTAERASNIFWRRNVMVSIDGNKVTYGESKLYTESGKDYFDRLLSDKIKNEKANSRLE